MVWSWMEFWGCVGILTGMAVPILGETNCSSSPSTGLHASFQLFSKPLLGRQRRLLGIPPHCPGTRRRVPSLELALGVAREGAALQEPGR